MSVFYTDIAENMKDPEFAYQFGRYEREIEIVKLLESQECSCSDDYCDKWATGDLAYLIALIKGENK